MWAASGGSPSLLLPVPDPFGFPRGIGLGRDISIPANINTIPAKEWPHIAESGGEDVKRSQISKGSPLGTGFC